MHRLLFVDNDRDTTSALTRWFSRRGFETSSAEDVAAALRALEASASGPVDQRIDAVCTDLLLPDGNALDVLRAARRLLPGTPVLLLTAYASSPTAIEAMRLGTVTLLEKAAEMDELERQLRSAIGSSKRTSQAVAANDEAGLVSEAPAPRNQPASVNAGPLPDAARPGANAQALLPREVDRPAVLAELDERLIQEALERTGRNREQAAKFLALSRRR